MTAQPDAPSAPEILAEHHVVDAFDCGDASLNAWLRRHAMPNQVSGASRTFVVCRGINVIGYYALAAGGIASSEAPGRLRRNMPDPIPVIVLGRLAVDRTDQGRQLGSYLLRDAVIRTHQIANHAGIAGILVHAISEQAKAFYLRRGFVECPSNPLTLVARMRDLDALVG
jgi:GNAT superfamily N-acetyltransferase